MTQHKEGKRLFAQWETAIGFDEEIPTWGSFIHSFSASPTHTWERKSFGLLFPYAPLAFHLPHGIRLSPCSSLQTFSSWWRWPHPIALQPSLHKLSISLHRTSQYPYSYSSLNVTVLNECYNISCRCILLGDWATKVEVWWKQPVRLLVDDFINSEHSTVTCRHPSKQYILLFFLLKGFLIDIYLS